MDFMSYVLSRLCIYVLQSQGYLAKSHRILMIWLKCCIIKAVNISEQINLCGIINNKREQGHIFPIRR